MAWKVFYSFDEKPSLKTKAKYGRLCIEEAKLVISGEDKLELNKSDIISMKKIRIPLFASAVQVKTANSAINLASGWFHLFKAVVFGGDQGKLQKALFKFYSK